MVAPDAGRVVRRTWLAWAGLALGALVLVLFLRWFFRSDAQRISEAVEAARDALVQHDDEAFLAFFTPDLAYQGGGDLDRLRRDLGRWHEMGIRRAHIVDERIDADPAAGRADVGLTVLVGHELLNLGHVEVVIDAVKDAEGDWRVRAFSWQQR